MHLTTVVNLCESLHSCGTWRGQGNTDTHAGADRDCLPADPKEPRNVVQREMGMAITHLNGPTGI